MPEQTTEQQSRLGVWNQFDSKLLDHSVTEKIKAVRLEVSLSPYEIPQAYRGYYCTNRKRFVVEFKYISDEPTKEQQLAEHLIATVGKKSGRLYAIAIDVDSIGADSVNLVLQKSKAELSSKDMTHTPRGRINSTLMHAMEPDIVRLAQG